MPGLVIYHYDLPLKNEDVNAAYLVDHDFDDNAANLVTHEFGESTKSKPIIKIKTIIKAVPALHDSEFVTMPLHATVAFGSNRAFASINANNPPMIKKSSPIIMVCFLMCFSCIKVFITLN